MPLMNKKEVSRRRLLKWSISLAAFYPVASGLQSCQDSKTGKKETPPKSKEKTTTDNKPVDFLYYNSKSKVLHYPGIRTKQKLDLKDFEKKPVGEWQKLLNEGARFPKETSGIAFEKLSLRNFQNNVNADGIKESLAIMEKAFGKEYANKNKFNWRIYELLLQWIALDESLAATEKSAKFMNATQAIDIELLKLPKRMNWMKTKEGINARAAYVFNQKNKYMERLQKRTT
jgi:hypothetical protein